MNFNDLHVVVTGGTGALGLAVVQRLLTAGATCHLPNFDPAELEQFPLQASGNGQAIVVRGEAGIGKTRLVEELIGIAADNGFVVHKGLVLDFGVSKGQDAIRSVVRSLIEPAGPGVAQHDGRMSLDDHRPGPLAQGRGVQSGGRFHRCNEPLRGNVYFPLGNIDGCRACVEVCREHGYGRIEVANRHMVGWTRIHLMEFAEALEDALESAKIAALAGGISSHSVAGARKLRPLGQK